ncbi:TIGR01244 family phosphatase [Polymorphobacter fuscus]|uniref:TIGR01244 family phosphatase n=2 Tax=Sandarakinorhabdus fusca TaxID=1439888 RepID=A0A7C9KXY8_9SPHN|nr:TIGR01244 family sulfur transferase [Polymorphobacter fuscus]KAB7646607.1 TIGR01244 family phosphatase [Polymorphobacter fuscus]MQT17626.1 TIGR01244 family phosphatase [Polymorphobacter fuscus]
MFIRLTPDIAVAAQIAPEDCAAAAAQGYVAIISNRPDDEVPGQPSAAKIGAAAAEAGLRFAHIPVGPAGIDEADIAAMAAELAAGGPVLAYCRSGTRSTNLWALAAASRGGDADAIVAAAAAGGYDVSGMAPFLRSLAARA